MVDDFGMNLVEPGQVEPMEEVEILPTQEDAEAEAKLAKEQEEAFVSSWQEKIEKAEQFHKDGFARMEEDMKLAYGLQWPGQTDSDDRYMINIIQQVIRQRVSALYAKNPTVVAKRKNRMDFQFWDGKMESLQQAMADPMNPASAMLITDVMQGKAQRQKLDGIAKTLEIYVRQVLKQQYPNFKRKMKGMVRRAETCGVAYLKLDFQREMQARPEIETQLADCTTQLSHLEMLLAQEERGDFDENSAKAQQLKNTMDSLQKKKYCLLREGFVFSFPKSRSLLIDPDCSELEGFLGANFIAERYWMDDDLIERIYQVDVRNSAQATKTPSSEISLNGSNKKEQANVKAGKRRVYEIYSKLDGTRFTILVGHATFLKAPEPLNVCLERFFPYFAFAPNEVENEEYIIPPSSVRLMRHVQLEQNRSKEALRQHRIAKAPKYGGNASKVNPADRDRIAMAPAHFIQWFESLQPGERSEDLFWEIKTAPIDMNVYETASLMNDVTLVVGMQDAHLGSTSGATATESSIAEDSRMSSIASTTDDLDDFLTEVFVEVGNVALIEVSAETVKKICGPGAVWGEFSAEEVIEDIYLEIEAGSSGRPNKALEISALERLYPLLIQLPGITPDFLAKKMIKILDEAVDLADAYMEGLPSIQAMNAMVMKPPAPGVGGQGAASTGNPATDPHAQGQNGATKQPAAPTPSNQGTISRGLMQPA